MVCPHLCPITPTPRAPNGPSPAFRRKRQRLNTSYRKTYWSSASVRLAGTSSTIWAGAPTARNATCEFFSRVVRGNVSDHSAFVVAASTTIRVFRRVLPRRHPRMHRPPGAVSALVPSPSSRGTRAGPRIELPSPLPLPLVLRLCAVSSPFSHLCRTPF
jgi:hypothetical protein